MLDDARTTGRASREEFFKDLSEETWEDIKTVTAEQNSH